MKNKPIFLILLGVLAGILLTFFGVIATGGVTSAYYMRQAEAAERNAAEHAADARRADDEGRPALDDFKGATVVIDVKMEKDGLVVMVGDGTIMRQVPRQELATFLKAMRKDGKTQANLRADGESPYKNVAEIIEEVRTAGFDKINLRTLPNK